VTAGRRLAPAGRGRSLPLSSGGAAVGVPCLLAGVTGGLVLFVMNYADKFGSRRTQGGGELDIQWGLGLWLALASLILALTASCILLRPGRL
jgi:hypothetical protein